MITIHPVRGLPEVRPGDDLAQLIAAAVALRDGDVVVVSQKVVSKAEGALVQPADGEDRHAARARLARALATAVLADTDRVLIVRTAAGLVCANAGIDASNVPGGALSLLPEDADRSARDLRRGLQARCGARVGVVVADTFGRAWRIGQTEVAIGVAGLPPLRDERGGVDAIGQPLTATVVALADEVAAAADLVRRKAEGVPAVVVRGLDWQVQPDASAAALVRPVDQDLFPRGRGMLAAALAGDAPLGDLPAPVPAGAWQRAAAAARRVGGTGMAAEVGAARLVLRGEPLAVGAGAGAAVAALADLGHAASWHRAAGPPDDRVATVATVEVVAGT